MALYNLKTIAQKSKIVLLFLSALFFLLFTLFSSPAYANHLSISGGTLTGYNETNDTYQIQFDISWSNSWRDEVNYDAVWVFAKISWDGTTWYPAILKSSGTNPSGTSQGTGTGVDLIIPDDKRGTFIQRSATGTGSVSTSSIQLVWDHAATLEYLGGTAPSPEFINLKIFGIEMAYIPEGGFYAGDGNQGIFDENDTGDFAFGGSEVTNIPPAVSSEGGISFGAGASQWYDGLTNESYEVSQSFPKGFHAFYLMKYELTQGQYTDFLNTLTRAGQKNRVESVITGDTITNYYVMTGLSKLDTSFRNTITSPSTGNGTVDRVVFSVSRPYRAMNHLLWKDLSAYADWAGLRPMTELEYVKAARGPIYPVANESAWGTTNATAAGTISGTENGTETITTANANYNEATLLTGGDGSMGPLRVGVFATSASNTREKAGAGYYGNLDLSGNVAEQIVTVSNSAGRGFSGTHGDGVLSSTASYEGSATNLDWPGIDATNPARGITGVEGAGMRGGSQNFQTCGRELNCRNEAATGANSRYLQSSAFYGGRLARTSS